MSGYTYRGSLVDTSPGVRVGIGNNVPQLQYLLECRRSRIARCVTNSERLLLHGIHHFREHADPGPNDQNNTVPTDTALFSSMSIAFRFWRELPYRFAPRKIPSSRGMLNRGKRFTLSSVTLDRSWIPNRLLSMISYNLSRRTCEPSSPSFAQRATQPQSWTV